MAQSSNDSFKQSHAATLEWSTMRDNEPGIASRRAALKVFGAGGAVAATGALLAACNSVQQNQSSGGAGNFPKTPQWKFVFVNHVTTNSFFVPTRTGLEDAAALL